VGLSLITVTELGATGPDWCEIFGWEHEDSCKNEDEARLRGFYEW
jgi:hypothetical protein